MKKPASTTAGHLLSELKELHQQLGSEPPVTARVPVLDDVVSMHGSAPLSLQQELLIRSAEKLIPQIVAEFTPLIAKELGDRLRQEMRQIMHSQNLRHNPYKPD